MGRGIKRLSDATVDLDHKVMLLSDFLIPLLDVMLDPGAKRLANKSVNNINDPLARKSVLVDLVRQIVLNNRILSRLV